MSRTALPYSVGDIASLAKSLRSRLLEQETTPGHVEILNLLARSAGCRNFQHFRANAQAQNQLDTPNPSADVVDFVRVRALARHFDGRGRLIRWPSKRSLQLLCLWVLWAAISPRQAYGECEITQRLAQCHLFGDAALLRRELCDQGLVQRAPDCREYRRVECRPPAEAQALIRHLRVRAGEAQPAAHPLSPNASLSGKVAS
jgi:hypothetical protein